MVTMVTLGLYSGRPNPRFELPVSAEKELFDLIRRLRPRGRQRVFDVRPSGFGVFQVTRTDERGRFQFTCGGGVIEFPGFPFSFPDDVGVEPWLIGICPPQLVPVQIQNDLLAILRWHDSFGKPPKKKPPCPTNMAADSPVLDIYWGANTLIGSFRNRQPCNNCYDYANQQMTDTFSQPGLGSGQVFQNLSGIAAAAQRDGLIPVNDCTAPLAPGQGWYVALLLGSVGTVSGGVTTGPEPDFHWIMQNSAGCWSHKLGGGSILTVDSAGNPIQDPKQATFIWSSIWRYDKFAGYFRTTANVTIAGFDLPTYCPESLW